MIDARDVTAVVVTYNRLPLLRRCLAALQGQTAQGLRVLVVDNASADGTAEYLKTLAMSGLVCRILTENLGGAGGFAYGMQAAAKLGCKAVWLMDDDTLPEPQALEALLAADAAMDGAYGWLSSRALAPDGSDQPKPYASTTPLSLPRHRILPSSSRMPLSVSSQHWLLPALWLSRMA